MVIRYYHLILSLLIALAVFVFQGWATLEKSNKSTTFSVSQSSFELNIEPSQIEQLTFSITNDLDEPLEWNLNIKNKIGENDAMGPGGSFENKAVFSDSETSKIDRFLNEADADEQISVIVEFKTDEMRETGEKVATTSIQQQQLADVRDNIINQVAPHDPENIKQYQFLPMVAMKVNRNGLEELLQHPQVKRVVEDKIDDMELEFSTSIIGAPAAWDMGYSGEGQTIVILDTGIDGDHPFFENRIVEEYCFSTIETGDNIESLCPDESSQQSGEGASEACDDCSHGTHVAGIAAGNGDDLSGVAPDANIIPMQIFSQFNDADDCGDSGAPCLRSFQSDQLRALEKIYEIRGNWDISSVNMSLGGGRHGNYCYSDIRSSIVDQLAKENIATITSSGNNGYSNSVSAPACIPGTVSVGSTTTGADGGSGDNISGFSNGSILLDLLAPGSDIYSAVLNGEFGYKSGTSMASPHVSGAWAVYKSHFPDATVNDVLNSMQMSGRKILDDRNSRVFSRLQIDESFDAEYWLTSDKFHGTLPSGESEQVQLTFDAVDLEPGTYRAELAITASDPEVQMSRIPIELEVIPEGEVEIVWPGDTYNNGEVMIEDVLPVGLCYGQEHDGQLNPGSRWKGYYRQLWDEEEPFCMFADANGDGRIDRQDVDVISENYGRSTPDKALSNRQNAEQLNGNLALEWKDAEVNSDDEDEIIVALNSEEPIYGISFTLSYQFPEERPTSWGFLDANLENTVLHSGAITLQRHQQSNWTMDLATVGIDQQTEAASGELMRIPVTVSGEFEGEVILETENIKAINSNGDEVQLESGRIEQTILPDVNEIVFEQNYPNPFNSETTIRIALPQAQQVSIEIYDVLGRRVQTLVDEQLTAGWHNIPFNASGMASGMYIYRMVTGDFVETKKMMHVK